MLTQLTINQFTVVESLEAEFSGGLTVITGETGAGKSIMIDALGLCLGDRADASAIRPGQDRADITATFDISALKGRANVVGRPRSESRRRRGNACCAGLLTREGRSRAYINGRSGHAAGPGGARRAAGGHSRTSTPTRHCCVRAHQRSCSTATAVTRMPWQRSPTWLASGRRCTRP